MLVCSEWVVKLLTELQVWTRLLRVRKTEVKHSQRLLKLHQQKSHGKWLQTFLAFVWNSVVKGQTELCWKRKYLKLLLVLGPTGDGRHGAIVSTKQQTVDQVSFRLSNGFLIQWHLLWFQLIIYFILFTNSPSYFVDFILEKDTIKQKVEQRNKKVKIDITVIDNSIIIKHTFFLPAVPQ